jgi:hypothetical protein
VETRGDGEDRLGEGRVASKRVREETTRKWESHGGDQTAAGYCKVRRRGGLVWLSGCGGKGE